VLLFLLLEKMQEQKHFTQRERASSNQQPWK